MRFCILLAYAFMPLSLSGCGNVDLKVSDSRASVNADGDEFIDVKLSKNGLDGLNKSEEALYLHVFRCDHDRNSSIAFPLVGREPVEIEASSVWMRFSVKLPKILDGAGACGYLSSAGYSFDSFSSGVFTLHLKSQIAQ